MVLIVALVACMGPRQAALPEPLSQPVTDEVQLILVGDTGVVDGELPGDPSKCAPSAEGHHITADCRAVMIDAMKAEEADGIAVLGDIVYWAGPKCPATGLSDKARDTFDEVLGSGLGTVGPPVWLAMGNHDKAQRHSHPKAERCYRFYAEQHPTVVMPDLSYTVQLGPVLLGVIDTTRHPDGAALEQLQERVAAHRRAHPDGRVILAGHHPVRTYRDDTDQPAHSAAWVRDSDLQPDLWASGHAHYQQMTVEGGVPNATTGCGGKHRGIADCPVDKCGEHELWSWSEGWGYAVARFDGAALTVDFKQHDGSVLYSWSDAKEE